MPRRLATGTAEAAGTSPARWDVAGKGGSLIIPSQGRFTHRGSGENSVPMTGQGFCLPLCFPPLSSSLVSFPSLLRLLLLSSYITIELSPSWAPALSHFWSWAEFIIRNTYPAFITKLHPVKFFQKGGEKRRRKKRKIKPQGFDGKKKTTLEKVTVTSMLLQDSNEGTECQSAQRLGEGLVSPTEQ